MPDKDTGDVTRFMRAMQTGTGMKLMIGMMFVVAFGTPTASVIGMRASVPDPAQVNKMAEAVIRIEARLESLTGDHTRRLDEQAKSISQLRAELQGYREGRITRREFDTLQERVRALESR